MQQLDLFRHVPAPVEPSPSDEVPRPVIGPDSLEDEELLAALPHAGLADSVALTAEVGWRRLSAARSQARPPPSARTRRSNDGTLASPFPAFMSPAKPRLVLRGIVRIEIDVAADDQAVPELEDIAEAAAGGHASLP